MGSLELINSLGFKNNAGSPQLMTIMTSAPTQQHWMNVFITGPWSSSCSTSLKSHDYNPCAYNWLPSTLQSNDWHFQPFMQASLEKKRGWWQGRLQVTGISHLHPHNPSPSPSALTIYAPLWTHLATLHFPYPSRPMQYFSCILGYPPQPKRHESHIPVHRKRSIWWKGGSSHVISSIWYKMFNCEIWSVSFQLNVLSQVASKYISNNLLHYTWFSGFPTSLSILGWLTLFSINVMQGSPKDSHTNDFKHA